MRQKLQLVIKNMGSKTKCPLALVNVDDTIFDHQTLARYIIYTIRMVAVLIRLVNGFTEKEARYIESKFKRLSYVSLF